MLLKNGIYVSVNINTRCLPIPCLPFASTWLLLQLICIVLQLVPILVLLVPMKCSQCSWKSSLMLIESKHAKPFWQQFWHVWETYMQALRPPRRGLYNLIVLWWHLFFFFILKWRVSSDSIIKIKNNLLSIIYYTLGKTKYMKCIIIFFSFW